MSQKVKLLVGISLLVGMGFLITSLASFFVSRASLRSEISSKSLPLTSDNIYSEIQRDLLQPILLSSFMASDTFLRNWLINGEQNPQKIIKHLKEIQIKYKTFSNFLVSEKTKNYYHFNGIPKKVAPDQERDKWYFRVRNMKEEFEINIDPDIANKDAMTLFINYHVYDYDNNHIGATGVGITVNAVNQLIEVYQQKYNRTIYFIDDTGTIKLCGSQFDKSIKNISQLNYASKLNNKLGASFEQLFTYKKDGQTIHTNIRYIKEFKWHLVVEQPEDETIQHIYKTLLINLLICLVITLITLTLVNYVIKAYQKRIETLKGIVPICSYCKQIRDDKGYWNRVEAYVSKYTEAKFSHSICPTCMEVHHPIEYESIKKKRKQQS